MFRPPLPSATRPASGYTLVEMLVTITILGVLAALIGMSYSTVRSSADKAECVANLRQIFTAAQSYVADHDGTLPKTGGPNWNQEGTWGYQLWPYVYGSYSNFKWPTNGLQMGTPEYAGLQKNVFQCPATRRAPVKAPSAAILTKARMSYGYNADPYGSDYNRNKYLRPMMVQFPAQTAMITETSDSPGDYLGYYQLYGMIPHNGASNVLFFDGHVETVPFGDIPSDPTDTFWTGR